MKSVSVHERRRRAERWSLPDAPARVLDEPRRMEAGATALSAATLLLEHAVAEAIRSRALRVPSDQTRQNMAARLTFEASCSGRSPGNDASLGQGGCASR